MSQPSRGALATYGKDTEAIFLRFWPNGTSQTTLTRVDDAADATAGGFMDAGGVASVQRTATAGKFTVTLEKGYTRLYGVFHMGQLGTPADLHIQLGTVTNEGSPASAMSFPVSIFAGTNAAAATTALTDSTAGTAGSTLVALTDPTDAPGSADILREDLVAVHWPILRNWAASLAAKFNALRAELILGTGGVATDVSASVNNSIMLMIVVGKSKVPR